NGPFYLYGYTFALNSAKTVASLTLPKSRNVIVLAADLSTVPVAATPTFSPAPGTYSSAQSVTLADTTSGAGIHYTTDGSTPTPSSPLFNPGTPIAVSATTTIKAMAVASGFANSAVATGTYVINSGGGGTTSVPLTASASVDAIVNNGSAVPNGGLDALGYAYSATLVGSSLSWNGNTYTFGSPGTADAVSNITLPLPQGNYTTLSLLATAVNGNRTNQVFTVNYTDGTSTNFTQSMSDWATPQNYAGESQALTMAYRVTPNGTLGNGPFYLYGYTFALNSAKTVASLTLPKSRNVIVLAADLQ
ncbi:MAG: chitobiase/beta-hexosaminidase C-terminal domain-containing protein, partial [Sinobacteraceae bacterium]|nr:chitobiase/beta-hexosaminidase C-terminal domain-containing protein [Nevskiaceae bacterium]